MSSVCSINGYRKARARPQTAGLLRVDANRMRIHPLRRPFSSPAKYPAQRGDPETSSECEL